MPKRRSQKIQKHGNVAAEKIATPFSQTVFADVKRDLVFGRAIKIPLFARRPFPEMARPRNLAIDSTSTNTCT